MKSTSIRLGAAALGVLVTTALVAGISSAHFGAGFLRGPMADPEKFQEVSDAIENNDYQAWLEAVGSDSKAAEKIDEEKFSQMAQIHQLKEEGKTQEARELAQEFGMSKPFGGFWHGGPFAGHKKFNPEKMEAIKTAMENNDYQAWLEAVGEDSRLAEFITEENFSQFVQLHQLHEEGKFEEAKALADELGIRFFRGRFKDAK